MPVHPLRQSKQRKLQFESLESRACPATLLPTGDGVWDRPVRPEGERDAAQELEAWWETADSKVQTSANPYSHDRWNDTVNTNYHPRSSLDTARFTYEAYGLWTAGTGSLLHTSSYRLDSRVTIAAEPGEQVGKDVLVRASLSETLKGLNSQGAYSLSFKVSDAGGKVILSTYLSSSLPGNMSKNTLHWAKIGDVLRIQVTANVDVALPPSDESRRFEAFGSASLSVSKAFKPTFDVRTTDEDAGAVPNFFIHDHQYDWGTVTTMPFLVIEIQGLESIDAWVDESAVTYGWTVKVNYAPDSRYPKNSAGKAIAKPVAGFEKTVWTGGYDEANTFYPSRLSQWQTLTGGDLDVTAKFWLFGKQFTVDTEKSGALKHLMILGKNPTKGEIQSEILSTPVPANWPFPSAAPGAWNHYRTVLQRIAGHESQFRQFYQDGSKYAGHPLWNFGGDRGHGLMQITPSGSESINSKNVWDWRANLDAGIAKIVYAIDVALKHPAQTSKSPKLLAAFNAYNAQRVEDGKSPLKYYRSKEPLKVPDWTPAQRLHDIIRIYNGVGGVDSIGRSFLHEYEPRFANGLLDLDVDEAKLIGSLKWVRVATSRRTVGEPNYVEAVLATRI